MVFSKSITALGEGRVTSVQADGTQVRYLCVLDGGIAQRELNKKRTRENIVSYADECYYLDKQILQRKGSELSLCD